MEEANQNILDALKGVITGKSDVSRPIFILIKESAMTSFSNRVVFVWTYEKKMLVFDPQLAVHWST